MTSRLGDLPVGATFLYRHYAGACDCVFQRGVDEIHEYPSTPPLRSPVAAVSVTVWRVGEQCRQKGDAHARTGWRTLWPRSVGVSYDPLASALEVRFAS
jgi:hypothetical protein